MERGGAKKCGGGWLAVCVEVNGEKEMGCEGGNGLPVHKKDKHRNKIQQILL